MFYKDDEIKTVARGATNYDIATTHLRTNPKLYKYVYNTNESLSTNTKL